MERPEKEVALFRESGLFITSTHIGLSSWTPGVWKMNGLFTSVMILNIRSIRTERNTESGKGSFFLFGSILCSDRPLVGQIQNEGESDQHRQQIAAAVTE